MAHLALWGASHCETDGKTVGLREAPRRLRGDVLAELEPDETFFLVEL